MSACIFIIPLFLLLGLFAFLSVLFLLIFFFFSRSKLNSLTRSLFKLSNANPSSLNFPRVCWRGLRGATCQRRRFVWVGLVPGSVGCLVSPGASGAPALLLSAAYTGLVAGGTTVSVCEALGWGQRARLLPAWSPGGLCLPAFPQQLPLPQQAEGVAFPPLHHSSGSLEPRQAGPSAQTEACGLRTGARSGRAGGLELCVQRLAKWFRWVRAPLLLGAPLESKASPHSGCCGFENVFVVFLPWSGAVSFQRSEKAEAACVCTAYEALTTLWGSVRLLAAWPCWRSLAAAKMWSDRRTSVTAVSSASKGKCALRHEGGPAPETGRRRVWLLWLRGSSPPPEPALCEPGRREGCVFTWRSSLWPSTFLRSVFAGFSFLCLLATDISDSFFPILPA